MCSIIFVGLFPTLAHSVSFKLSASLALRFTDDLSSLPQNSNSIYALFSVYICAIVMKCSRDKPAFSSASRIRGQCKSHIQTRANILNKETRSRIKVECQMQNQYHCKRKHISWNRIRVWKLPSVSQSY